MCSEKTVLLLPTLEQGLLDFGILCHTGIVLGSGFLRHVPKIKDILF